jgi:hypothetical protein
MSQPSLLDRILSGTNRQLQVLAAQGLVPLPPEELIPIQVALVSSPDAEIQQLAQAALQGVEHGLLVDFLRHQAGDRELYYFATHPPTTVIIETVLRRKDISRAILMALAPGLSPDLQEVLILRQDAILDEPQILVALEDNPQLSNYTKRRIWEYREHLLPREKVPPKRAEEIQAEADRITEQEIAEAVAEVKAKNRGGAAAPPPQGEGGDERTGLTDVEIRQLPVPMRLKMARHASRQIRMILIRDANAQVAVTVLTANSIPESELEQIANSRAVCEEVLTALQKNRDWVGKYSIAKALLKNPKTQLANAMKLLPRMSVKDLRDLAKDKNAQEGVRTMAVRMYQAKR